MNTIAMSKNEIIFYVWIVLEVIITELGMESGMAIVTLVPVMLIMLWLGIRAFPAESQE